MDGFPSGQRGQTVNLLHIASVVRIHLHPFCRRGGTGRRAGLKILLWKHSIGSIPIAGMIIESNKKVCILCMLQTVDKALREIMFLGAFFYHYKDVWG